MIILGMTLENGVMYYQNEFAWVEMGSKGEGGNILVKTDNIPCCSFIKPLRWFGRLVGFVSSVVFLFFFIGEGVSEGIDLHSPDMQLLTFAILLFLSVSGCVVALFKERAGGIMQLAGGCLMAVYHFVDRGMKDADMALIFGLPFIFSGVVCLICSAIAFKSRKESI